MEGFAFQVEVIRTDRKKSASIQLDGDLVKIRVPKSLSDKRIRELIAKRTPWIQAKFKERSERPVPKPKEYVSGESLSYLGKNYRLKVVLGANPAVKIENGDLVVTIPEGKQQQNTVKRLLEIWYRTRAEILLREKTERFSKIIKVSPRSVSVGNYKSRWGACSSKGDITYNWKLILTPHRIVDYVVVHELCHLLEHNHSPRYWRYVERYFPDWKECREWLKSNPVVF